MGLFDHLGVHPYTALLVVSPCPEPHNCACPVLQRALLPLSLAVTSIQTSMNPTVCTSWWQVRSLVIEKGAFLGPECGGLRTVCAFGTPVVPLESAVHGFQAVLAGCYLRRCFLA